MAEKKAFVTDVYTKVKGELRALGLDQAALSEKLGSNPASVSKALNGNNEKVFRRIIDLLEAEYGLTSLNQHIESSLKEDIAQIKTELAEIKAAVARIEAHLNKG
jgi:transcriptional regulator with XRE-family HTH domain